MIIDKQELAGPVVDSSEKSAQFRSESIPEPILERELPPPYAEGSRPPGGLLGLLPTRENSVFQPTTQQHVNYVTLYSNHHALSGTYIIDPELPAHAQIKQKSSRLMINNITPNASFETRHGSISLNLATAGGTNVLNKTYVRVASRHGRVNVNLFALQENKHICLNVRTRQSAIVIFIPPNFEGALQLYSRKGSIKFLPAFAQRARVINADDKGATVLFGHGELSCVSETSEGLDHCAVNSRHGRITIGVSGIDQLDEANDTSLIKKLGTMFLGPDIMRTVDMLGSLNSNSRERSCPLSGSR